jgi:Gas vesicle synthesis protein GvpL/GvpF
MIRLYAVAGPAHRLDGARLQDAGLRVVSGGTVLAVVGGASQVDAADEDALWGHEEVVESLMDGGTVLPARFGTAVTDEDALRVALERRSVELLGVLERVANCVEVSARALWLAPVQRRSAADVKPEDRSGRAYMHALAGAERDRAESLRRGEEVAGVLDRAVAERARDTARRIAPAPHTAAALAYLVERGSVDEVVRSIEAAARTLDDVEVVCTGPWPPYNFATVALDLAPEGAR